MDPRWTGSDGRSEGGVHEIVERVVDLAHGGADPVFAATGATTTTGTTDDCVTRGDGFCTFINNVTHNRSLARTSDWLIARPLTIVLIVVLALLLRYGVRRTIDRLVERVAHSEPARIPGRRAQDVVLGASPIANERRRQRTEAMGSVLRSIASFLIFVIAALMVLSELGLDLAPVLASAGIAGVAIGFGAQNLVKDFLAGMFVIFEDQYGVGDTIDMGQASGTVQAVGLRVTQLKDADGVVWYVRNGEVVRVGNRSQSVAQAVLDVGVAAGADTADLQQVLRTTAERLAAEPEWQELVVGDPEITVVDGLAAYSVVRLTLRTRPLAQGRVADELQARLRTALVGPQFAGPDSAGPELWMRTEGSAGTAASTG